MKTTAGLILALLIASSVFPQQAPLKHCGFTDVYNKVMQEHPELLANQLELEDHTQHYQESQTEMPPVYTIPVVFHIVHWYGVENISDAQVLDAMRILNEDFRRLNADISNVVPPFNTITSDAEIEFSLAKLDPNGNCHTGIDRIASPETFIGDDGSKLNSWPRNKYLNIWVVNNISSGAAGYAYLPGTAPTASVDGIMILHDYVGSIGTGNYTRSRALTHEVGHFFNLRHTWGNTNQPGVACGDDNVTDTPVTKGWTSCNLSSNDICNPGTDENVQNYMEYAYCPGIMFTNGQRTRMRAALTSTTAGRNNLPTTSNLASTGVSTPFVLCAPVADFMVNENMICAGGSVTFTDVSWKGQAASWSWSFPGGTPSTSTDSIVPVTYNTPGTYSVTLTVSNASGTDTETKTSYIQVLSTTAMFSNTYTEGFENVSVPNTNWTIVSNYGNAFSTIGTVAYNGTWSLRFLNNTSQAGFLDEAVGPTVNLSSMGTPTMTFRVAFAQRAAADADLLRVLISTDCGVTWTPRYTKSGSVLKTANPTTGFFTPNSTQWRLETVSIAPYVTFSNVRYKFEFTSDGGNNLYIDDINIMVGASVTGNDYVTGLQILPNPFHDAAVIRLDLKENTFARISLYDLAGREVLLLHNGNLNAGENNFTLNKTGLSPGVYLLKTETEGGITAERVIVQ